MGADDYHVSAKFLDEKEHEELTKAGYETAGYEVTPVAKKLWKTEERLKEVRKFAKAWESGAISAERFAEATYGLLNENSPKADGHPPKGSNKTSI